MRRQRYLLDKSALARWAKPPVAPVLDELSDRGLLAVCGAVEIEVIHSARTVKEAQRVRWLLRGFDWLASPRRHSNRLLGSIVRLTGNYILPLVFEVHRLFLDYHVRSLRPFVVHCPESVMQFWTTQQH
jgi:hypothetical protein